MWKRSSLRLLAAVITVGLAATGCSRPTNSADGGTKARNLVFAYITPETFPYHDGAKKFKELIEQNSGGKFTVQLHPAGQLGNERDINESILDGAVHIGVGAGALAGLAPSVNLLELPFLIKNQDHMQRVIDSPAAAELAKRIKEEGKFEVIDWFSTGDSSIQSVDRPIRTPADLKGLKLRSIENPALADALQTLGANPTPMPFGEVYTGVQTGVVKGATLDWGSVYSLKLHELIKYATTPDVAFLAEPRPVIMSSAFWDSLSDEERKLIDESMAEAAKYEREVFRTKQQEAIDNVVKAGVTLTDIDEKAFDDAVRPAWDKWAKQLKAEQLLEQILAVREG
ncbi:TRAP transporter substrate-binding protein [Rhizomonospora bruguierae]|uniref:TRAP transporter substrate-binding protein n=1 Tax=Rhizomonospora bruguierae TaxID=1581705 RepID=UPI001BCFD62D|nr:TRAP transporter substrate-binding protein [Micromonospora sp. NBRC 107566]